MLIFSNVCPHINIDRYMYLNSSFYVSNFPLMQILFLILARPRTIELLRHRLFWNSEKRLSFLRDTSERVDDPQYSSLSKELRKIAVHKDQDGEFWKEKIDYKIISHMNNCLKQKQKHC